MNLTILSFISKTIKNTSNSIICFEEMNEKLEEENIQKEESIKMIEKTYYECPSMKAQHYYSTTLYR